VAAAGGPVQRLNLGLFIYPQHQRTFGRVEVKAHDVSELAVKLRVSAELEVLHPMRLQPVLLPDAMYGGGAEPDLLGFYSLWFKSRTA